jgi:pyridoxine/pyridoxamine 5'-phosphate oxidase
MENAMQPKTQQSDGHGRPPVGTAARTARAIIDANLYLVLATADRTGRPWSSPVYFAHDDYREFLWVSAPEATHSRNIATRPQVGIVIYDSHAPISTGQGVYISANATQVDAEDLTQGIETFSQRAIGHGGVAWTVTDVQPESGLQLYRAVAESFSILAKDGQPDHRIPVRP